MLTLFRRNWDELSETYFESNHRSLRTSPTLKPAGSYLRFVKWSEEDQCHIGYCPDLYDGGVCHGENEGDTYAQLCAIILDETGHRSANAETLAAMNELEREIEAGRQNIENFEAFVEMERAKLEENPEYDPSFLEEALHEQQEVREAVESGEKRLKELTPASE